MCKKKHNTAKSHAFLPIYYGESKVPVSVSLSASASSQCR